MDSISKLVLVNNTEADLNHSVDSASRVEINIRPSSLESNAVPIASPAVVLHQCAIPCAQECLAARFSDEARAAYLGLKSQGEVSELLKHHPRGTYICYHISEGSPRINVTWKSRQSDDIKSLSFIDEKMLAQHVSVLQPYSQELESDPGFCGHFTKDTAMELLSRSPVNTYLIRRSTSRPNSYSIDIVGENGVSSILMRRDGLSWRINTTALSLEIIKNQLGLSTPLSTQSYVSETLVGFNETNTVKVSNVKELFIEDCVLTGPYILDNFLNKFPNLTGLHLSHTRCSFGMETLEALLSERPGLKVTLVNSGRFWNEYTIEGVEIQCEPFPHVLPKKAAKP